MHLIRAEQRRHALRQLPVRLAAGSGALLSRTRAAVLPLLLATAASFTPGQAQAQPAPHWYAEGKLISRKVRVSSVHTGGLFIHLPKLTLECSLHITAGTVTNPSGGEAGIGELSELKPKKNRPLAFCEAAKPEGPEGCTYFVYHLKALSLPVRTHLAIEPSLPGVRDVIEGTPLELECELEGRSEHFAEVAAITGALKPRVGNSQLEFEGEAVRAELFKQDSEVWGKEAGPNEVVTVTFGGSLSLQGKGQRNRVITAQ